VVALKSRKDEIGSMKGGVSPLSIGEICSKRSAVTFTVPFTGRGIGDPISFAEYSA